MRNFRRLVYVRALEPLPDGFSEPVVEVDLSDPRELDDDLDRVIAHRMGMLPAVYSSLISSGTAADRTAFWDFARRSYLDNPLPALFKERLFVTLSRFSRVRYCIVRHAGFLIGKGYPAGDASAPPQPIENLLSLLKRPLYSEGHAEQALIRLASTGAVKGLLHEPDDAKEHDLFLVLAGLFMEPERQRLAGKRLRTLIGDEYYHPLQTLLVYIKTEHFRAESHPDLTYESDMLAVMQTSPELSRLLLDQPDIKTVLSTAAMRRALIEIKQTRAALDAFQDRNAFLLELGDALRPLSEPAEMQRAASRLLSEYLKADWVLFAEFDGVTKTIRIVHDHVAEGAWALERIHSMAPFLSSMAELRAGRTTVDPDISRSKRLTGEGRSVCLQLGLRSLVSVPIIKDGSLIATLSVAGKTPRNWTIQEVTLIEDIAGRISSAIERAHAEQKLLQREADLTRVQQIGNVGGIHVDVASGFIGRRSPEYRRIHGLPDHIRNEPHADWLKRVHPDDRAAADRTFQDAMAGSADSYESEYRIIRPNDGKLRWIFAKLDIERDTEGRAIRLVGAHIDITDRKFAEETVRDSEHRLRTLMEGIPQLVWRSRDDGQWSWAGPQWLEFTGQTVAEAMGRGWLDAIHPDDRPAVHDAWRSAMEHGSLDVEHRVRRAADGAYFWHHTRSAPLRDTADAITEWLGTTTDVQQMKGLQNNQALMVAELQHRTRNLIAVVRAIAHQTMMITGPTHAFEEQFGRRLAALARVQSLLSRSDEEPITMEALVRLELDAIGGQARAREATVISGPAIHLRHSIVQTLTLALHELATNACNYGALHHEDGRLSVTWSMLEAPEASPCIKLVWVEQGPALSNFSQAAMKGGYGRQLIERALPYTLGAKTKYELNESGVLCEIEIPVEKEQRRST